MQTRNIGRVAIILALAVGAFKICAAQETYNLRGAGAKAGTSYTQKHVIKVIKKASGPGQPLDSTVLSTAEGMIQIKTVAPDGEITEASETYTGQINLPGGQRRNFPSPKLFNRKIMCSVEEGIWHTYLDDLSSEEEVLKENSDLPIPGPQRDILPSSKVPIGHKWEIGPDKYKNILAVQNPKYAKWIKIIGGNASFTFEKIGSVNGVMCAYISTKLSFKAELAPEDGKGFPVKINLKGHSSDIRRLDLGILVQQESLLEMVGSEPQSLLSLSIDRFMTQKLDESH